MGDTYVFHGDYVSARIYLDRALEIAQRIENPNGTAVTLGYIGGLCLALKEYGEAEKAFTSSLKMYRKLNNNRRIKWCLLYLGQICMRQGHLAEALEFLLEAKNFDYAYHNVRNYVLLGIALTRSGDFAEARVTFDKSIETVSEYLQFQPSGFSALFSRALALAGLCSISTGAETESIIL